MEAHNETRKQAAGTKSLSPQSSSSQRFESVFQTDVLNRVMWALRYQLTVVSIDCHKKNTQPGDLSYSGAKPSVHEIVAIQNHREDWP